VVSSWTVDANTPLLTGIDFGGVKIASVGSSTRTNEGSAVNVQGFVLDPTLLAATNGFEYHWEVRQNGQLLDSTSPVITHTAVETNFEFVPADNGRYTVSLLVNNLSDNNHLYVDSMVITADNVAPQNVQIAGVPAAPLSGDSLTLSASFSDPGSLDTFTYQWNVYRNNLPYPIANSTHAELTFIPNDIGQYKVTLRVTDKDGASTTATPQSFPVGNGAPQVSIGDIPSQPREGTAIQLKGIVLDPGFDDPIRRAQFQYQWSVLRNGVTYSVANTTDINLSFVPVDDGIYAVTFTSIDEYGLASTQPAEITLNVANVAPSVTIHGQQATMNEGSTLSLSRSITDPGNLDQFPLTVWNIFKDGLLIGSYEQTDYSFNPGDNGTYTIQVISQDNGGAISQPASITIQVNNVVPSQIQIAGLPSSASEGQSIPLSISKQDPGYADTFVYQWKVLRNGESYLSFEQPTAAWTFTPSDDGNYEFEVKVRDDDMSAEEALTATASLTVTNRAPTASPQLAPASPITEGSTAEFRLSSPVDSVSDTEAGFTFAFDLDNDGSFEISNQPSGVTSVSFPTSGQRVLRGRITDKDGASTIYTFNVEVQNVSPTISSFFGPLTVNQGSPVEFSGTFVDPGQETWFGRAEIRKQGQNTSIEVPLVIHNNQSFTLLHTFGAYGTYDVTATIFDRDGGASVPISQSIVVQNIAPALVLGPTLHVKQGRTFSRTISFTDPGLDPWQATVDYDTSDSSSAVSLAINDASKTMLLSHTYNLAGTFNIGVTVDDGLNFDSKILQVVVDPNVAPVVIKQIPNLTVRQGFTYASDYADLALIFDDPDGYVTELSYSVQGNSNPSLVHASLCGPELSLAFDPRYSGTATITLRAVDIVGEYAEVSFDVVVLARDTTAPTSFVNPLPPKATSLDIPISVTGSDPAGPANSEVSGVREYDLYVAAGSGPYTKFATIPASNPTTIYRAESNRTLYFKSVARDNVGNLEPVSSVADTVIVVGDFDAPVTQTTSATANSSGLYNVFMQGGDTGGSGLAYFDLYVSMDGGVSELVSTIPAGTPNAQGTYAAQAQYQARTDNAPHTYRFFSIGRDAASNIEQAPLAPADLIVSGQFGVPPLQAVGIDVQQNALQRSYIRYLDVLFSKEDGLDSLLQLNPIKIERFALDAAAAPINTGTEVTGYSISKMGNKARIDWGINGITGNRNTNALDGFYRVLIDGNSNGNYNDAVDSIFEFARIFGDATGDETIDAADIALINSQIGRSGSNLNGDIDGSLAVNAVDRLRAQSNLNKRLADHLRPMLDD
jgi:hypothetical protein